MRFGYLLLGALLAPALLSAQQAVEMWEEPRHQLVLELDNLKLVLVNIPPGDTSLFHMHRYATAYVIVSDALVEAQNRGETNWKSPDARAVRSPGTLIDRSDYPAGPFAHRVRNLDNRPLRLLALVNLAAHEKRAGELETGGLLDNAWFREHRLTLGPGAESEVLVFENPAVVVQISAGRSDAPSASSGSPSIQNIKTMPGAWSWHGQGSAFRLRNLGPGDADFVVVEVKMPASEPRN